MRDDHIGTVFFERLVSPKLAETVAREAGAKTAVLDPIEGLTPSEEKQGLDYIGADAPEPASPAQGARVPLALELTGVDFAYGQGPQVLKNVDLRVEQGEFVAIAGPNGGGKTTLLRIALGLERPTHGRCSLYGEPARSFRDRTSIGYLAQRTKIGLHAPATVRDVVEAGRAPLQPVRPVCVATTARRSTRHSSGSGCARWPGGG